MSNTCLFVFSSEAGAVRNSERTARSSGERHPNSLGPSSNPATGQTLGCPMARGLQASNSKNEPQRHHEIAHFGFRISDLGLGVPQIRNPKSEIRNLVVSLGLLT